MTWEQSQNLSLSHTCTNTHTHTQRLLGTFKADVRGASHSEVGNHSREDLQINMFWGVRGGQHGRKRERYNTGRVMPCSLKWRGKNGSVLPTAVQLDNKKTKHDVTFINRTRCKYECRKCVHKDTTLEMSVKKEGKDLILAKLVSELLWQMSIEWAPPRIVQYDSELAGGNGSQNSRFRLCQGLSVRLGHFWNW